MRRLGRRPEGLILDKDGQELLGEASVTPSKDACKVSLGNKTNVALHRFLWEKRYGHAPDIIDHINCNWMDNRFSNLRPATSKLNALNSKKFKGFYFDKKRKTNPYQVKVAHKYVGRYQTQEEAVDAYKAASAILILEEQLTAEKEWLYE